MTTDFTNTADEPENAWDAALAAQRETAEQTEANRYMDQFGAIENDYVGRMSAIQRDRARAFMAGVESAARNGGAVSPALRPSLSQAFGMDISKEMIVDGKLDGDGNMVFRTVANNGGKATPGQFAVSPAQGMRLAELARIGSRALPYQRATYDLIKRRSGLTDSQLEAQGIRSPDRVIDVTRGGEISANGLRPRPRQPGRISVFATDGRGGYTRSEYDGATGERTEENGGTRDPGYKGRWKVLRSGADDTTYENDKTGETVTVPKGESPSMRQSERKTQSATAAKGDARGQSRFNKDEYNALVSALDALDYETDQNGLKTKKDKSGYTAEQTKADESRRARLNARIDAMLGIGEPDEAQRHEAKMRRLQQLPQQRFNIVGDKGGLLDTNGYVLDGRYYDVNGNDVTAKRKAAIDREIEELRARKKANAKPATQTKPDTKPSAQGAPVPPPKKPLSAEDEYQKRYQDAVDKTMDRVRDLDDHDLNEILGLKVHISDRARLDRILQGVLRNGYNEVDAKVIDDLNQKIDEIDKNKAERQAREEKEKRIKANAARLTFKAN